ncbi:aminotransferase class I/II-fold pyridoxal phosphate-dependent enzyme [Streptomyces mirabilis]|uniref:aminotransferase class I/II-fold pyridoxal phosphate-dependent enzyme n=1 Tax=Streptomyces mirabilis TaxID=68239 RepID=UPI0036B9D295
MHAFMNVKKTIQTSSEFWGKAAGAGLGNITANIAKGPRLVSVDDGREFLNMSSFSYLGLESHPKIVEAASEAVLKAGALNSSTSRMRTVFEILGDAEDTLSDLFRVEAITTTSCAAAAWQTLPLLASGAFTDGHPPLMVFDKNAHFCINAMKPSVADETHLLTIPHNDLDALEDISRKNRNVVYIADSVYSTGGCAPVKELLALQDRHGLFLLFDEAHGISSCGANGRGIVLDTMGEINDRTMVITSLNKGFGASGGAIFLGRRGDKERRDMCLHGGGPLLWSQRINTAGLGAVRQSADIHRTPELEMLQRNLHENIAHFDNLIRSNNRYDNLPIRFINIGEVDETIRIAQHLFENGFYVAPLFFPVIGRGRAGLRVMLRADMTKSDITRFAELLDGAVAEAA